MFAKLQEELSIFNSFSVYDLAFNSPYKTIRLISTDQALKTQITFFHSNQNNLYLRFFKLD